MFDLEESIAKWRQQMLAAGIQAPVPLEELEIHLRDEIERQMKSGLSVQPAFESAIQQIGQAGSIKSEFAKVDRTKTFVVRGLKLSILFSFSALVVALNIYLASELKTICLFDLGLLSFVLPFMANSQSPKNATDSKRRSRIVWTGLMLMGLCGFAINFSPHPVFSLLAAVSICIGFALMLRQPNRAAVVRS